MNSSADVQYSPYVHREQEVEMGFVRMEEYDGGIDIVFFASGTRRGNSREGLYFTLNTKQLCHLYQHIQTRFGFSARQPIH